MDLSHKIPVSLFIGEKNFVQKKGKEIKTGYKRHYESEFFNELEERVDLKAHELYPIKGKKYSVIRDNFLKMYVKPLKL